MEIITFWTAFAAISACFASVVALVPIFINAYKQIRYADNIRSRLRQDVESLMIFIDSIKEQEEYFFEKDNPLSRMAVIIKDSLKDIYLLPRCELPPYSFLQTVTNLLEPGVTYGKDHIDIIKKYLIFFLKTQKKAKFVSLNKKETESLFKNIDNLKIPSSRKKQGK